MRHSLRIAMNALALASILPLAEARDDPGPGPAPPAVPGATVTIGSTSERDFPDITLDFQVTDARGEPILDAGKADFRVTEYDAPVAITRFTSPISKEVRPTTIVLVLDHSSSMRKEDRIGGLKRAVRSLLGALPEGSRVAVVAFGSDVRVICPFTSDPARVQEAVDRLRADGNTRYYDAVTAAVKLLSEESGRRAVLAMTDGEDNVSLEATLESAIRDARREGLPVHTLGLGSEDEIEAEALRVLAEQTRGRPFSAREADGLGAIFEEIARGLGRSYSLTYRTNRKLQDGTLRPIRVDYAAGRASGVAKVYIPGMVVPAAGWPGLFLALVAGLLAVAALPGRVRRAGTR